MYPPGHSPNGLIQELVTSSSTSVPFSSVFTGTSTTNWIGSGPVGTGIRTPILDASNVVGGGEVVCPLCYHVISLFFLGYLSTILAVGPDPPVPLDFSDCGGS